MKAKKQKQRIVSNTHYRAGVSVKKRQAKYITVKITVLWLVSVKKKR